MVRPGESFRTALKRQMFEEFGLEVDPWFVVEDYEIHVLSGQQIIPGVRFLCKAPPGEVRLSKREFSTCKWIKLPLRESLDWISGIEETIRNHVKPNLIGGQSATH